MNSSSRYSAAGMVMAGLTVAAIFGGTHLSSSAAPSSAATGPATAVMTGIEADVARCMTAGGYQYTHHVPLHAALDDAVAMMPDLGQRDQLIAQVRQTHPTNPNPAHQAAASDPAAWATAEATCRDQAWGQHTQTASSHMAAQDQRSVRKSSLDVSDRLGSHGAPGPGPAPPVGAPAGTDPVEHYLATSAQYRHAIAAYAACVGAAGLPATHPAQFGQAYTHSGGSGVPDGLSSTARRKFIERADATDRACIGPVTAARDTIIASLSAQP